MVVHTASGRGRSAGGGNLAAARATVTRLRLGMEAARPFELGGAARLTPSLEIGLRHDGGDAETGFGLDLGGGLALTDPGSGLEAELRGRGLLSHESQSFRERGFSGALRWRQKPSSDRGAALTVTQTVGGSAAGGVDVLLSRTTLDGLAANDNGGGDDLNSRLDLKLGYGLSALRRPLHAHSRGRLRSVGCGARLQPGLAPRARRIGQRRRLAQVVVRSDPARERQRRRGPRAHGRAPAHGAVVGILLII